MMRTSVYTFLLLTCLLLTPSAVLAGADDSGLQVFTVDFSKQLGESNITATEDSFFSPYCYNLLLGGNGFKSWSYNSTATYTRDKRFIKASKYSQQSLVFLEQATFGGTYSVSLYDNSSVTREVIASSNSTDLFTYQNNGYLYVLNGTSYYKIVLSPYSSTAITGLAWQTVGTNGFTTWNNRLWIASYNAFLAANTLFYSSASDWENFTSSPTAGGVISLPLTETIRKINGTLYGLYIFTDSGIWLLSGGSSTSSWDLKKISNLRATQTFTNKNVVYFTTNYNVNVDLYYLDGIKENKIARLPIYKPNQHNILQCGLINDRYFVLPDVYGGTSFVYDIETKTGFQTGFINGIVDNIFFIRGTASNAYTVISQTSFDDNTSFYFPQVSPWAYQTAWFTLDGNASNRKEIDRIEFDYQGGTTAVYLYFAYGNGSLAGALTTLTAPINTRLSTYVWNAPIGRQQSNRFYLYFLSSGTQTMTTNYILKQARIYYRNIGNYKTNSLR